MANVISVPFTLLMDGGIVENNPKEGPTATVKFKCLTSNRYQLVTDLMGITVAGSGIITRVYPFPYPPSPNLVCRNIESIEQRGLAFPLIPGTPWVGRQYSIVTARFEPAWFFADNSDPSGKPYTATSLNLSSESMPVPNSVYTFPSGTPTNVPVARQIPQIQITFKRFMMPYLPIAEMAAVVGCVNSSPMTVGDFTCPEGTVLFVGGPSEFTADTQGNKTYTVEYQFVFRAIPWNVFLSSKPGEGFAIPVDSGGNPIYPSADLTSLP